MSTTRRLPRTDEERTIAINKAKNELAIVLPAEITITPSTKVRLLSIFTDWKDANDDIQLSEAAKTNATILVETTRNNCSMFIRHFIMVFNFGVERGVYPAGDRNFYYLDAGSDALPALGTEEEIILWGNRIVDGDAARVTAGGAAMSNPTAAEVSTVLTAFTSANNDQNVKTAAWKADVLVRTNLRPEADKVILKVWDETETFYNELPAPTKRDKCRPWGVVYENSETITINLEIINNVTNAPIDEASTFFEEGNTTLLSNAAGVTQIKTSVADLATLKTSKTGYTDDTTVVTFVPGQIVYAVTIRMIPV